MSYDNVFGIILAVLVFYGMYKLLGPKPKVRIRVQRATTTRRRKRRVRVDPLIVEERRLLAELQAVRAQMRR